MRFTTLNDWLAWLERLHPKEIELGLARVRQVAEAMELVQPSARIVTVAGTNGKGSCVAAVEQLLLAAGLRVGAYTSPHLLHYCERIRLQGKPAQEAEVCAAFDKIDRARGDISLTYFEFGTLAAVELFCQHQVDVMVLEVGLGGRLDAVNVWDADVAVITSIAIDHQAWLGNDRESIGREKAGILRPHRPAICADADPPASIATAAAQVGAPLLRLGRDFHIRAPAAPVPAPWSWCGRDRAGERLDVENLPWPQLPVPSVAGALQAVFTLGITLDRGRLENVLSQLALPGRKQRAFYRGKPVILDVAHNPAAAAYLAQQLQTAPMGGKNASGATFAVIGIMADKDRRATLAQLLPVVDRWIAAGLPDVPRAADVGELLNDLDTLGVKATGCDTVAAALDLAVEAMGPDDRILVVGSFYTVAAALFSIAASGDKR